MSLLLCLKMEFNIAKPDLWGQRAAEKYFDLRPPSQSAWEDRTPHILMCVCKNTEHSPTVPPSARSNSLKSCIARTLIHTQIHSHLHPPPPVLLLPIKIWRAETVRLSFLPRHRGSSGNIQTALPQAMKSNRSSLQSEMSVIKGCSFPVRVSSDPVILMPKGKKKPRRKRLW